MNKNDEFQRKLDEKHGNIELISDYTNSKTPVRLRCRKDGYEWEVKYPAQLVRNKRPTGCPRCSNNEKGSTEKFKSDVKRLTGDEYTVIGEYVNNHTPVKTIHNKCGKIFGARPGDFVRYQNRCPYCSHGHTLKTQEEFEKEVRELTKGEYTVVGTYKGTGKYVKIRHEECGNEFMVTPRNFLSNSTRCPECAFKISRFCKKVEKILSDKDIKYLKEVSFDDLKDKRCLKIDYYLPSINLYIEVDGNQHFEINKSFGGEEYLKKCRKHDIQKNEYFIANKLNLLRVDSSNYGKFGYILTNIINKRSTTNSKYNLYYIEEGNLIFDNGKYTKM